MDSPAHPTLALVPGGQSRPAGNPAQRRRNHRTSGTAVSVMRDESNDDRVRLYVETRMAAAESAHAASLERDRQYFAACEARARRTAARKPADIREAYLSSRLERERELRDKCLQSNQWPPSTVSVPDTRDYEAPEDDRYSCFLTGEAASVPTCWDVIDPNGNVIVSCKVVPDPDLLERLGRTLLQITEHFNETPRGRLRIAKPT